MSLRWWGRSQGERGEAKRSAARASVHSKSLRSSLAGHSDRMRIVCASANEVYFSDEAQNGRLHRDESADQRGPRQTGAVRPSVAALQRQRL